MKVVFEWVRGEDLGNPLSWTAYPNFDDESVITEDVYLAVHQMEDGDTEASVGRCGMYGDEEYNGLHELLLDAMQDAEKEFITRYFFNVGLDRETTRTLKVFNKNGGYVDYEEGK